VDKQCKHCGESKPLDDFCDNALGDLDDSLDRLDAAMGYLLRFDPVAVAIADMEEQRELEGLIR